MIIPILKIIIIRWKKKVCAFKSLKLILVAMTFQKEEPIVDMGRVIKQQW